MQPVNIGITVITAICSTGFRPLLLVVRWCDDETKKNETGLQSDHPAHTSSVHERSRTSSLPFERQHRHAANLCRGDAQEGTVIRRLHGGAMGARTTLAGDLSPTLLPFPRANRRHRLAHGTTSAIHGMQIMTATCTPARRRRWLLPEVELDFCEK